MNGSSLPRFTPGFLVLFLTISSTLTAQSFIHRYRFPTGNHYFFAVNPLRDGRIVVGGSASNPLDKASTMLLDAEGEIVWYRLFGGQLGYAWAVADMAETPSGNVLALLNVTDSDNSYTNLARLSVQNGQIIDAKRFGDNQRYAVYYQLAPTENGFILSGAEGENDDLKAFSLAKTDMDGEIIWQRAYRNETTTGALRGAVVAENNQIWAAAALENTVGTIYRAGLMRFNENGDLLAAYQIRANDPLRRISLNSIAWQPGVGPVLGCFYYTDGPSNIRPLIIQCDTSGQVIWSKVFNTTPSIYNSALVFTQSEGNLLVTCGSGGAPNLGFIALVDAMGSTLWSRDLSTDDGPESLLAARIDAAGQLYGAGLVFAPLPALERKGFVFKTDDPLFNQASCCTREIAVQTLAVAVVSDTLTMSEYDIAAYVPVVVTESTATIERQPVCQTPPPPALIWSDTSVCPGQCVTVRFDMQVNSTYTLTIDGPALDTVELLDSVLICFPKAGLYTIRLDDGDCSRFTAIFEVKSRLPAPFSVSDSLICPGQCITVSPDAPPTDGTYVWSFEGAQPDTFSGAQPPEICFDAAGIYTLRLYLAGCGFEERQVEVSSRPFSIPNAFSPNDDQTNDVFRPILECPEGAYNFEIYARWGQKIFSTFDPEGGWDGKFDNRAAPVDTYIWVIQFSERDAEGRIVRRSEQGHVTLLR